MVWSFPLMYLGASPPGLDFTLLLPSIIFTKPVSLTHFLPSRVFYHHTPAYRLLSSKTGRQTKAPGKFRVFIYFPSKVKNLKALSFLEVTISTGLSLFR